MPEQTEQTERTEKSEQVKQAKKALRDGYGIRLRAPHGPSRRRSLNRSEHGRRLLGPMPRPSRMGQASD